MPSKLLSAFAREPVMLGELIKSGLTLAIAFGAKLTLEQLAALYGFISLAGAFVVRAFVTPTSKTPPSAGAPPKSDSPKSDPPRSIPPVAAAILLGMFGCGAAQEPSPCSPADYAVLSATCGNDQDICDAKISERETLCAERIRGDK